MKKKEPNFIFETSWEVCNKVGGIYAVLSTRARSMQRIYGDNLLFIGPDIWKGNYPDDFVVEEVDSGFKQYLLSDFGLKVAMGRWAVPGNPRVALVDFSPCFIAKNDIYARMWNSFKVDSLHAYGDYDEASMFGYASGVLIHAFYLYYSLGKQSVVAHFNEWMTAFGLFYLRDNVPSIASVFTTHATTVGRSIAGNNKPLYDYMKGYFGNQMARELNVESKHSVERQAALWADCFTTVSDITNVECTQLLEKSADVVTPNGFENDFVPAPLLLESKRSSSHTLLLDVASRVLGYQVSNDAVVCATSGRYEFKNKGLDVSIAALSRVRTLNLNRDLIAFIFVPAWHKGVANFGADQSFVTHSLVEPYNDRILRELSYYGFSNSSNERVKVIFVPAYLMGSDGVFNLSYYDVLMGVDFSLFPSYYEPWGYTPLESVAFGVPTITSDLAGFGIWCGKGDISDGVAVVHRNDHNFDEAVENVISQIIRFFDINSLDELNRMRKNAQNIARNAEWNNFFKYYVKAYNIAISNCARRNKEF